MLKEDYGVRKKPITARNPQANAIIERVHQTVGQMLRTHRVQDTTDLVNPLKGILSAICFATSLGLQTLSVPRIHLEEDTERCPRTEEKIPSTC